jgi:AraC-like DNA-binding protein
MLDLPVIEWPAATRPRVVLAGVFSLVAHDFDHVYRSHNHALHLHDYHGVIRAAGRDHALVPGTLTFSPAEEESSYDLPRPGSHWCIHFAPQPAAAGDVVWALPRVCSRLAKQADTVRRFEQIIRLTALSPTNAAAAIGAAVALQELLAWVALGDAGTSPANAPNDVIDTLTNYIDRNLARPLDARQLAKRAALSQNYLARVFRQRTGMTLPRYILTRRVALARLLLNTTDLPVKQVALRAGLPDAQHFNKQFRALSGVSPTAYRRSVVG